MRGRDDVLWITFEDLKEDLEGSVKKVADFLQIECDAQLLAMVCLLLLASRLPSEQCAFACDFC